MQTFFSRSDVRQIAVVSGGKQAAALEDGKVEAAFPRVSAIAVLRWRDTGVRVPMDPRSPDEAKGFYGVDRVGGYCLSTKAEWLAPAMAGRPRWIRARPAEQANAKMRAMCRGTAISPDGQLPTGDAVAMRRTINELLELK